MLVLVLPGIQPVLRPSSSRAHQYIFQVWLAHGTMLRLQSKQRWEHCAGLRANLRQSTHKQALLEFVTKHDVQEGLIRICNLGRLREVSQHWLSELHPHLLLKFFSFKPLMYFCFILLPQSFLIIVLALGKEFEWNIIFMLVLNSLFIPLLLLSSFTLDEVSLSSSSL